MAEPMLLARLLTDDLPTEIEELLRKEGVPLFPKAEPLGMTEKGRPIYDVRMKCSCPDWARPCKHIVAVLLLLGEEISRRPVTLLSLRGVDVDDLLPTETEVYPPVEGYTCDGNWSEMARQDLPGSQLVASNSVDDPAPLLRRLGPIPFWRGEARCLDALGKIYKRVRPIAEEAAQGKSIDLR